MLIYHQKFDADFVKPILYIIYYFLSNLYNTRVGSVLFEYHKGFYFIFLTTEGERSYFNTCHNELVCEVYRCGLRFFSIYQAEIV